MRYSNSQFYLLDDTSECVHHVHILDFLPARLSMDGQKRASIGSLCVRVILESGRSYDLNVSFRHNQSYLRIYPEKRLSRHVFTAIRWRVKQFLTMGERSI